MAYARGLGDSGLGFGVRNIVPAAATIVPAPATIVQAMPFRMGSQAVSAPASTRTGPSNEDVFRSLYGSVEKGRAAQAASIAEARQRNAELFAASRLPQPVTPIPPAILDARDYAPTPVQPEALVPDEDVETEGDVIEEVAEGEEEGDAEFSGWGIGMGERPVGVAFTRREVARMGDVRRNNQRMEKERRLAKMRLRPKKPKRPMFGFPGFVRHNP